MGILSMIFGLGSAGQVYADSSQFEILDVRTTAEFSETHVQGAVNIDFLDSSFKTKVSKLDKNKVYKLYCRSGNRSGHAEQMMKALGFKNVENLGSVAQASKRLNRPCEGKSTC